MATCKDCLHNEICKYAANMGKEYYGSKKFVEALCEHFIYRSRFLALPCKVGDTVYVITRCRCGNPECYENKHCHKKETKKTPKVYASKMVQQMGWKRKYDMFGRYDPTKSGWQPNGTICYRVYKKPFELKMLAAFCKTVFLTFEEAEKALKELKK